MSPRRACFRLGSMLAASALLAACAVAPRKPTPKPATVVPHPQPPPTTVAPLAPAPPPEPMWSSLTGSFAMDDCNDSPLVRAKLAAYSRSPGHFEELLRHALPMMVYVQKQLDAARIPGEFVMLPMLESTYNPSEPSRRGDPAGMWQLMPHTARRHGITITRAYDGRLDPVASTRVAVEMLTAFHKKFGDWRLADMAYNAGSGALARALHGHRDPGDAPIPDIPVSSITRKHLAKLMALSCIVREPERFHVKLPQPAAAGRLIVTRVPAGTALRDAADMAGLSESQLRAMNPGYLGSDIPRRSPGRLLLPAPAADALSAALAAGNFPSVAELDNPESEAGPDEDLRPSAKSHPHPDTATSSRDPGAATMHRVRAGESLWSIARHYHVTVADLKRWNHLSGDDIRPGEELRVGG